MSEVKSCGVIVFRRDPMSFLLMKHPTRWDLPNTKPWKPSWSTDRESRILSMSLAADIDAALAQVNEPDQVVVVRHVTTNQFVQLVHRDGFMVDCPVAQSPADFRDTITKLFGDEPIEDEDFETWQHTFDTAAEAGALMLRVLTEGFGHDPADRFDIERY